MKIKWKDLITAIAVPLIVGGLSSIATKDGMEAFAQVRQPPLTPPDWLFPVVWTLLYVLMGIASYQVFELGDERRGVKWALYVYAVQLVFNFFWSVLFFNLQMYLTAFVWLIALWILILVTAVLFYRIRKSAGLLLVPYILWVTFAGYLNFGVWLLN